MTEYERTIKNLAKEKKNEVFYNSSDSHARVVLNNMVENAERYVHIVCGNMCTEVSSNPEFLDVVKAFLSKDASRTFYVLFDEYKECFLETEIAKLLSLYPTQVKVKKLKSETHLAYKEQRAHLAISDGRAFRLETDVDKKMAFGNFNDEENVKVFEEVFNSYFEDDTHSESIDLTDVAA
ncbi:MAG: hypothetical protein LBU92_04155 [Prevotellaceae bacterium]|jgi:hypothetical protein|nr:hypothetical protein [Prevotellaceae bacterium]